MSRTSVFQMSPPADAQTYGRLRWTTQDEPGRKPTVRMWVGKSLKPKYFSFINVDNRTAWIEQQKKGEDARDVMLADRKAREAAGVAKMSELIQVGTLLSYSWGYDQTNVEFFQVVERKKSTVVVREIASREVDAGEATRMSGRVQPVRDEFKGPPMTKRICSHGLSMDFGIATPTTDDATHYSSWYC